ncbi:hypothetical protein [Xanthovirga aplysinae]|uniref:hypothetical protein n=1 Tax=Xanthovirga aplysinae TaxID=2529853 RepID=UPI0012BBB10E|nr:hypothetical protein [Xanthovirga aplysinae]MTI33119.1 hypothetical protein [Xanthovirga aplysinae]
MKKFLLIFALSLIGFNAMAQNTIPRPPLLCPTSITIERINNDVCQPAVGSWPNHTLIFEAPASYSDYQWSVNGGYISAYGSNGDNRCQVEVLTCGYLTIRLRAKSPNANANCDDYIEGSISAPISCGGDCPSGGHQPVIL